MTYSSNERSQHLCMYSMWALIIQGDVAKEVKASFLYTYRQYLPHKDRIEQHGATTSVLITLTKHFRDH